MQDDARSIDEDHDLKTEWAERRTDWAEDRTVQANERTFAGWMRTGMGAVAVAIGLKAVFGAFEPFWVPRAVASLFILAAVVAFWSARNRAILTQRRLHDHVAKPLQPTYFTLIAAVLTTGAVATGAILWLL